MTFGDERLPPRFWSQIDIDAALGCWLWTGRLSLTGYGQFKLWGLTHRVHRIAYRMLVGPIPAGLEIDHVCRVPSCANPQHMEPVTHLVNVRRSEKANRTACARGHLYTPDNSYWRKGKHGPIRGCKPCTLAAATAAYARVKATRG